LYLDFSGYLGGLGKLGGIGMNEIREEKGRVPLFSSFPSLTSPLVWLIANLVRWLFELFMVHDIPGLAAHYIRG
jgi:hypothetical protein